MHPGSSVDRNDNAANAWVIMVRYEEIVRLFDLGSLNLGCAPAPKYEYG